LTGSLRGPVELTDLSEITRLAGLACKNRYNLLERKIARGNKPPVRIIGMEEE
jgi:hypothetical protein